MEQIKAVVFDYGGVLSTEQDRREVEIMLELLKVDADRFHHWYYHYRPSYDLGSTGEEYWRKVLAACEIQYDPEVVAKVINHDCRSWTKANPAMLNWAAELKQTGYKLGIISNMVREVLVCMQEEFNWLKADIFTSQIFSCDWQVCKPDPRIYRLSLEELRLEPEECLFIDDLEANIKAAQDLGYAVFHYRGPADLTMLQESLLHQA